MKDYEEMASEVLQQRDDYEAKRTQRRKTLHRRLTTTLTALAIVLTVGAVGVGATAIISGTDWFAEYYGSKTEGNLSDNQAQYLETNVVNVQQTVTAGGYTMTLGGVCGSRNRLDVYLEVVAPEGTSLEGVNLGLGGKMLTIWKDGQVIPLTSTANTGYTDEDPKDNKRTYLIMAHASEVHGMETVFSEGGVFSLTVNGLHYGALEKTVSTESWSFDFELPEQGTGGIKVIQEPVECTTFNWVEKQFTGTAQVESFTLYEMSGKGTYRLVDIEGKYPDVLVTVVMKDGRTVTQRGGEISEPKMGIYEFEVDLFAPIVLSEVDYVIFGGYEDESGNWVEGTRVDIP